MIAIDESHTQRELDRWSRTVATYISDLGLSAEKTVERQAGLLARTLVNISPPADRAKTAQNIEESVSAKFESVAHGNASSEKWDLALSQSGGKHGSKDVYWYSWTPTGLYGVAPDADLRDATPKAIAYLAPRMTPKGKLRLGRRGKQMVYLSRKLLTKPRTVKAAIKIIQSHIGRLKAGWLVGWRGLGAPGAQVPQWIARHESGAHGFLINSASVPGMPSVTIANFARGVENLKKKSGALLRRALEIRSKAVARDLKFAIKNPKAWKERQSAAGLEVGDFS